MRSLLLLATGNKLRALAAQKTTNVITNVTSEQTATVFSFQFHYCVLYHQEHENKKKLNAHGCIIPCSGFIFRNLYGFLSVAHHKRCYFCVKLKSVPFQLLVWALRLREIHVLRCTLPLHNVVKALRLLCSHSRTYNMGWPQYDDQELSFAH